MDRAVLHRSCWSDEYLVSHCEGYRVVDETGDPVGWVDRVLWSDEEFGEAEAVVVRYADRLYEVVIPLERVIEIEPWAERVVVRAPVAER